MSKFMSAGRRFACIVVTALLLVGCAHHSRTFTFTEAQIQTYKEQALSAYKSTITNSAFPQYLELNPEAPVRYRISFEGDPKLVVNIPTGPEYSAEVFELGGFTFRWAVEVTFDLDTHEIIGVSANSVWFDQEPESETLESSVE